MPIRMKNRNKFGIIIYIILIFQLREKVYKRSIVLIQMKQMTGSVPLRIFIASNISELFNDIKLLSSTP